MRVMLLVMVIKEFVSMTASSLVVMKFVDLTVMVLVLAIWQQVMLLAVRHISQVV
jgi:hypothetical protein